MNYKIIEEKEILHEVFVELIAELNRTDYKKSTVTIEIHKKAKFTLNNLFSNEINTSKHIQEIKDEYFLLKKSTIRNC